MQRTHHSDAVEEEEDEHYEEEEEDELNEDDEGGAQQDWTHLAHGIAAGNAHRGVGNEIEVKSESTRLTSNDVAKAMQRRPSGNTKPGLSLLERRERRRESNRLSKQRCRAQRRDLLRFFQKQVKELNEEFNELTRENKELCDEHLASLAAQQEQQSGKNVAFNKPPPLLEAIDYPQVLAAASVPKIAAPPFQQQQEGEEHNAGGKLPPSHYSSTTPSFSFDRVFHKIAKQNDCALQAIHASFNKKDDTRCVLQPFMLSNNDNGKTEQGTSSNTNIHERNTHESKGAALYALLVSAHNQQQNNATSSSSGSSGEDDAVSRLTRVNNKTLLSSSASLSLTQPFSTFQVASDSHSHHHHQVADYSHHSYHQVMAGHNHHHHYPSVAATSTGARATCPPEVDPLLALQSLVHNNYNYNMASSFPPAATATATSNMQLFSSMISPTPLTSMSVATTMIPPPPPPPNNYYMNNNSQRFLLAPHHHGLPPLPSPLAHQATGNSGLFNPYALDRLLQRHQQQNLQQHQQMLSFLSSSEHGTNDKAKG